jgi:hypothetical protein
MGEAHAVGQCQALPSELAHGGNRRSLFLVCATLERAKGFEPSTPTLARSCSTPELRPLWRRVTGATCRSPVG